MSCINRYNTYWPYQSAIIKLLTFCLRTRFVVTINQINSILFAHLLPARRDRVRKRKSVKKKKREQTVWYISLLISHNWCQFYICRRQHELTTDNTTPLIANGKTIISLYKEHIQCKLTPVFTLLVNNYTNSAIELISYVFLKSMESNSQKFKWNFEIFTKQFK